MTFGMEFADGNQVLSNVSSPAGDGESPGRILWAALRGCE
jgi:hypothetical protein